MLKVTLKVDSTLKIECLLTIQSEHSAIKIECLSIQFEHSTIKIECPTLQIDSTIKIECLLTILNIQLIECLNKSP